MKFLYEIDELGNVRNIKSKHYLKHNLDKDGYEYVNTIIAGKSVLPKVHRLLMEVFKPVDNMEELTVNHIDHNKRNNSLDNLEWMTREDNSRDGCIYHHSETNLTAKHSKKQCKAISNKDKSYTIYDSPWDAAKEFAKIYPNKSIRTLSKSIDRACRQERKSAYGYHWEYLQ